MQSIGQINGRNPRGQQVTPSDVLPTNDNVGIELELEGDFEHAGVRGWDIHGDGSLRNGIEYVFRGPAAGADAVKRVEAMVAFVNSHDVAPTFRCSTHIHLDVTDLNVQQLRRLVATYCIFEDVMFDQCALHRRFSNFCIPYFVNDRYLEIAKQVINGFERHQQHTGDFDAFPKYSSFNLQPINRIGTVEFRGSHAMVTYAELIGLIQRMQHLKRIATSNLGETDIDFIKAVNTMNVRDAFPTGLPDAYVRDQETADICYSNALFLVTNTRAAQDDAFIPPPPPRRPNVNDWVAAQQRQVDPRDNFVVAGYNQHLLDRIGLIAPNDHSFQAARRLYRAIRTMIGADFEAVQVINFQNEADAQDFAAYVR